MGSPDTKLSFILPGQETWCIYVDNKQAPVLTPPWKTGVYILFGMVQSWESNLMVTGSQGGDSGGWLTTRSCFTARCIVVSLKTNRKLDLTGPHWQSWPCSEGRHWVALCSVRMLPWLHTAQPILHTTKDVRTGRSHDHLRLHQEVTFVYVTIP